MKAVISDQRSNTMKTSKQIGVRRQACVSRLAANSSRQLRLIISSRVDKGDVITPRTRMARWSDTEQMHATGFPLMSGNCRRGHVHYVVNS